MQKSADQSTFLSFSSERSALHQVLKTVLKDHFPEIKQIADPQIKGLFGIWMEGCDYSIHVFATSYH